MNQNQLGAVCTAVTGFAAWFFVLLALLTRNWNAAGIFLTAAAIAFGLLSRANSHNA
jgi:hypothetical protein